MRDKLQIWATKFSEAFTACGLAMVQGDITVLSRTYWYCIEGWIYYWFGMCYCFFY